MNYVAMKPDWAALEHKQKIALLRPMVSQGMSSVEIAEQFSGASRSAIIGYCYRNDLRLDRNSGRPTPTDRVLKVRDEHPDWTAKQASQHLGIHRNTVYGIASRLGFKWPSEKGSEPPATKNPETKKTPPATVDLGGELPTEGERVSFLEAADAKGCMWCDGDPLSAHSFCAKPRHKGSSWCQEHYARVYAPSNPQVGCTSSRGVNSAP